MQKKKNIWDLNPLRTFFGFRNFIGVILGRNYFSKSNVGHGFTLIELLVAVAITSVLAGSAFFVLNPSAQLAKARDAQRKNDLGQIRNALDAYYSDYSVFPNATSGIINGIEWGNPWPPDPPYYMIKVPKDPLSSQNYNYESDGTSYRLYAKLERCSDSGAGCMFAPLPNYNYVVSSSNLAILVPTSTPTPTPTLTPTPTPPFLPGMWTQCAQFTNTSGNDVSNNFMDNCLNATALRVEVRNGWAIEEDVSATGMMRTYMWPNRNFLGGTMNFVKLINWGNTQFFTTTDGRDICGQPAGGMTFGSNQGGRAIIAPGNTDGNEYRISCGGPALTGRQIIIYKQ